MQLPEPGSAATATLSEAEKNFTSLVHLLCWHNACIKYGSNEMPCILVLVYVRLIDWVF